MKKKTLAYVFTSTGIVLGLAGALIGIFWGHGQTNIVPENISPGFAIRQDAIAWLQLELAKRLTSAPARIMKGSGLAGAMGGAHVKVDSGDPQEILLPLPQLADGQAPICYFLSSTPPDAIAEFRLRTREDCNVVAGVRLVGKQQEVQIAWSSVVLFAPRNITPNTTPADPYRAATSCVQSQDDAIKKLATDLWPDAGSAEKFAANIQRYIQGMKRKEQPRSLDALGILKSGENGICTANANLASALMRSKGIPCRSLAVIPTISQRLEMHRIVEFFQNDRWTSFDPSSVQTDIPARPWQSIIMSKTTISDEQTAMKPRMGAMFGCPCGQEIELLTSGVNLCGQDFFWTEARSLEEFEPSEEAIRLAIEAWNRYLKTGTLTQAQIKASSAKTATELLESLRIK